MRAGLGLSRSTLAQWVSTYGLRLQPLVDVLKVKYWATAYCKRRDAGATLARQGCDPPRLPLRLCARGVRGHEGA